MESIMTRSSAEFWWNLPLKGIERKPFVVPKNVAYYKKELEGSFFGTPPKNLWKPVTWDQVMEKRRIKQSHELSWKRKSETFEKKAALIWVFKNERTFVMSGWWIYIKTLKKDYPINFRSRNNDLVVEIMKLHPMGIIPIEENIKIWCETFAKQYPTKSFGGRRKQGVLKCWIYVNRHDKIYFENPEN